MGALHRINLYDPYGNQVALLDDFSGLNYVRKVNDMGNAQFNLPIDARQLHTLFGDDYIVEIERAVPEYGIDWYVEWEGFHITGQRQITESGNKFFTSYCRTFEDLLQRCWIAYIPQTTDAKTQLAVQKPADNVMKDIVRTNVGPNIGGSRLIPATAMPNFSVAADIAQAPVWAGSYAYQNVLRTVQDIAVSRDVDFAVKRIQRTPVQFLFVTQYPLMGVDRSVGPNTVIFSTEFGNVKDISYTASRTDEITAALVLGEGQDAQRSRSVGFSTRLNASPYYRKEFIQDARNQDDDALEDELRGLLRTSADGESFVFNALQDSQFVYGRDYFVGDRVRLRFEEIERAKRLLSISVSIEESGEERMTFEYANYVAAPKTNEEIIRSIMTKIVKLENSGDI